MVIFVARVGAERVAGELAKAGPQALWLLFPYGLGTMLGAFPFGGLLPPVHRPTSWALVQGRFAASTASALLPFFGLMGEPSRLLWLPAGGHAAGIAGLVVDRLLYNSANGFLLTLGALVAALFTTLPVELAVAAIVVGFLTLAVTAIGLVVVARFGVGRRLHALLGKALGERYSHDGFGRSVDTALVDLVRGPSAPLVRGALVHVVSRVVLGLEVAAGLLVLDAGATPAQVVTLTVVPIALSFFFSTIPSQIGIQEASQTLVAAAIGVNPTTALAVVLLQRFRQLAFSLLLPFLLAGARPTACPQRDSVKDP